MFFIFVFGIPLHSFAKKGVTKGVTKRRQTSLKINIIRKAFSDVVLCLFGYVGVNVHGRF